MEQGCALKEERTLSFFQVPGCARPEDCDLTVRQNHHDIALAEGQHWPYLVWRVSEKKLKKKKERKKRGILAVFLEIFELQILAHLFKGGGAGSRLRPAAEGHSWALCFLWE